MYDSEMTVPAPELFEEINNITAKNCSSMTTLWGHSLPVDIAEYLATTVVEFDTDVNKMFKTVIPHISIDFAKIMSDDLFAFLKERGQARTLRQLALMESNFSNKTENRTNYLPEPTFTYYQWQQQTGDLAGRWNGETDLRSMGLLGSMMMDLHPGLSEPIAVSLLNGIANDEEGRKPKVPGAQWESLLTQSIAVSGERLGWVKTTPAWSLLTKLFPTAIDLAAYGHSLNSPLVPAGYIPNINVRLRVLRDREGNDLETDGSGWYHPDTPELQALIAKHGVCPLQLRFITTAGVFAKGVIFPCTDSIGEDEEPCVTLDWLQVKGLRKAKAKEHRANDKSWTIRGYMGILQKWNSPAGIKACFELLENIERNPITKQVVREDIDKAMARLQLKGIDGITAGIAADSPRMDMIQKLCLALKQHGVDLEPTQIPMVRKEVGMKLGKKLRHIGEGAGIKFKRYVCRLDSQVPVGRCVISGTAPDLEVAAFRFPLVLAQGLLSLKTMKPLPHLRSCPWTIVMNPADLVTKAQGDDDGDTMGISFDPGHIRMFKHLIDNRVFHIEPTGEKFDTPSDSPEGLKYLRYDQRGCVGRATIWRAKLLAIGDIMGANALSIVIQENIDCAKNKLMWSDYKLAADIRNWTIDENGEYHFDKKLPLSAHDVDGTFPQIECAKWVKQRLAMAGVDTELEEVLGWKWEGKRIVPSQWAPTHVRGNWQGGNLVHYAHDYALSKWLPIAHEFKLSADTTGLSVVVPTLINAEGTSIDIDALCNLDWKTYSRGLRSRSGLVKLTSDIKRILSRDLKSKDGDTNFVKYKLIDDAHDALYTTLGALSLEELATIWFMELQHQQGNINNAFRAICWNGSPVLKNLGIKEETTCNFLNHESTTAIIGQALADESPTSWLASKIFSSTAHAEAITDKNGKPVQGYNCKHCCDQLQTGLVVQIRKQKSRSEHDFVKNAITALNNAKY